ncbi:hypothetical protein GGR58DRAFT_453490, partial [Xylaria digitata]
MSGYQPIAQIFCRYTEKQSPRLRRPDINSQALCLPAKGFIDNRARRKTRSTVKHRACLDISILPNQVVRVGRAIEH